MLDLRNIALFVPKFNYMILYALCSWTVRITEHQILYCYGRMAVIHENLISSMWLGTRANSAILGIWKFRSFAYFIPQNPKSIGHDWQIMYKSRVPAITHLTMFFAFHCTSNCDTGCVRVVFSKGTIFDLGANRSAMLQNSFIHLFLIQYHSNNVYHKNMMPLHSRLPS